MVFHCRFASCIRAVFSLYTWIFSVVEIRLPFCPNADSYPWSSSDIRSATGQSTGSAISYASLSKNKLQLSRDHTSRRNIYFRTWLKGVFLRSNNEWKLIENQIKKFNMELGTVSIAAFVLVIIGGVHSVSSPFWYFLILCFCTHVFMCHVYNFQLKVGHWASVSPVTYDKSC